MTQKFKIHLIDRVVTNELAAAYGKFIMHITPVPSGVVEFTLPVTSLSDKLKEKLGVSYGEVDILKTPDDLFYSSYNYQTEGRREKIDRDDGYTGGDIYVYNPTMRGAVVSESGHFTVYPEKEYHYVSSHRDKEFDGTCGIYNPTYYYYNKTIWIELNGEKRSTTNPGKTLQEFASKNTRTYDTSLIDKILSKLAERPASIWRYNQDFDYYQTKSGESVYIAGLPIQQFNNGLSLFTAYTIYHTNDVEERKIHFFIPETKTHIALIKSNKKGLLTSSLTIDGETISLPSVASLFDARRKALEIPDAGRFSEILDTYVFADSQKQLVKAINVLDSYTFEGDKLVQKSVRISRKKTSSHERGNVHQYGD